MTSTTPDTRSAPPKAPEQSKRPAVSLRPTQGPSKRSNLFRYRRRGVQLLIAALLIAAPFIDLLRFDLVDGVLVLFGMRLGLGTDLWVVYGILLLGLLWIFGGALIHGRFWCGWICPQTLMSEWATLLETKIRGKSPKKRKHKGRIALYVGTILLASAAIGASTVTYFLTPAQRFAPPLPAWIGFGVMTGLVLANLLFLRHNFCLRACPYGVLLQLVQDPKTLKVELDETERELCISCKACERACFMDVNVRDPDRRFENACLICGLCIDACENVLSRRGGESIIHLRFKQGTKGWPRWLGKIGISDFRRLGLVVVTLAVAGTIGLMLAARTDIDATLTARFDEHAAREPGRTERVYRLAVTNRTQEPARFTLEAGGLEGIQVKEPADVEIAPESEARVRVVLAVPHSDAVEPGAHTIVLRLVGPDKTVAKELTARFFVSAEKQR